MSDNTKIQWADASWNPISGCSKVSQGCKNCYAAELHDRRHKAYLRGAKLPTQYAKPFKTVQLHPERMEMPLHWKKPRRIFVNSTSDLFHPDVDHEFIADVFRVMERAVNHTFMILTKRPEEMLHWFNKYNAEDPLPNVWLGVSVENQAAADERIPLLLQTPAAVRFLSCEPLLGPVDLEKFIIKRSWFRPFSGPINPKLSTPLSGDDVIMINWVIAGGESGAGARPTHPDWMRGLRNQCIQAGVPFFLKQWGEWYPYPFQGSGVIGYPFDLETHTIRLGKKKAGRLLDGIEWNEYPEGEK